MKFRAAVLERVGAPVPWSDSVPINVTDLELDPPGPGELLVRMEAAGVCHSDLSRVSGVRQCAVPLVLGHEGAGVVEQLGDGCAGLAVGQRVSMTFMPRCGSCPACTASGWALCIEGTKANAAGTLLRGSRRLRHRGEPVDHHGGVSAFAEYAVVDRHSVVPLPSSVPAEVAALLGCAVLTGGGAVMNAARLHAGETCAVVGMGGVGLAAALVARSLGAAEVVAVDSQPSKCAKAIQVAATGAYSPEEAVAAGAKFDVVVECAGHPAALSTAIALTKPGGRTVTVGLSSPSTRLEISPLELVLEARQLIGSYMGSGIPSNDIAAYAAMYLDGRLPVERLISGTVALDDVNHAMDELREGRALRQIIDFTGRTA
ncbi:alcohol dehydrogenase catalytic domain-containing protein [Streptomyces sp. NPDC056390]|uniref:alcohol dehydrogenase catalytic domain-containing protein n=1 Tax=Streptomyces sp. NPDC056390 TaxID=3345806 RepID=UPI0035E1CE49